MLLGASRQAQEGSGRQRQPPSIPHRRMSPARPAGNPWTRPGSPGASRPYHIRRIYNRPGWLQNSPLVKLSPQGGRLTPDRFFAKVLEGSSASTHHLPRGINGLSSLINSRDLPREDLNLAPVF
jgi:hypothetical protein